MPEMAPFAALRVTLLCVLLCPPVSARQTGPGPRDIVQVAERAVQDDSVAAVRARWTETLRRDSTDPGAALGLGSLARLTYDFAAAERIFGGMLARAGDRVDPWTIQARIGLYRVANSSGNTARADSLLNIAIREARRIGDRGGELDALIGLSGTRASRGPDAPALATLDTLRRVLPPGDGWERGEYLCRLGLFRGVGGDTGVTTLIRDGIAVAQRLGERQLAGHCLEALALVHSLHGKPDSVFPIMARAETLLRATNSHASLARLYSRRSDELQARGRLGDRQLQGHCLEALALVHSLHGKPDSVFPIMARAESLLRATNAHASLARLYSRRSDELQARGRLGEAKVALGQVLAEATLSRNGNRMANAYGGLGMLALRTGDLPSAADWFERAAVLYDSLGEGEGGMISRQNRAEVLAASGDLESARQALDATLEEAENFDFFEDAVIARQRLARLAMRRGDWPEAERQLAAAEAKARGRGLPGVAENLVYDRAVLALGSGRLAEAERLLGGFLAGIAPEDRLIRHTARVRLAELAARRGALGRAEREITAASRELEQWRESLGDDELRGYAFSATVLGEYDAQAATARVLAALAEGGRAEAAFALAEQRRARLLTDRLNQALALREPGDAVSTVGAGTRARPLSSAEIARALPDSATAVLEYVAGSEGAPTTLFVLSHAGVRAAVLPGADSLAPAIRRLVAMVENGSRPDALTRSLGRALLEPARRLLPEGVTRLLIIPDGPLHHLPFDALVLADGKPAVERWAIGLAPSASLAATLWRREASPRSDPASGRVLAMGDPRFPLELSPSAMRDGETYRSAFAAAGGLPRLEGSGAEARTVARYASGGAEVRTRAAASEAWLKSAALERFDVIHLATHALVDERTLTRTALALAPSGAEDGFLSPADIAGLRLDADLVVLSACRTAGGVTIAGEGVQGLTTPLMAAGARSVIATQWRVGDRTTVRLIADLYDGLARGLTVSDALREAKLAAVRRGAPPGEWAGFTVVGDPTAKVPLVRPSMPAVDLRMAAGLLLVAALGGYLALRRRGRRAERVSAGAAAPTHH
jgi:CHAT domain-containing protein/tetratricopeptide (TPR) repeat protein